MTIGSLYVVATPIGNLDDLSPRARRTLIDVDVIAAEDTRHTGRLLAHFGIDTRQIALHDHNEADASSGVIKLLRQGKSVALVSDAGTPLISDPGYRLVQAAHVARISVIPIPGASAVVAALSVAGLPSDRFAFEGFLPPKRDARLARLRSLQSDTRTLLFYESVHRIAETISDMLTVLGPRREAFIGRELSKLHEQCVQAPLGRLHDMLTSGDIVSRGEFVVAVAGATADPKPSVTIDAETLLEELIQLMPGSQAADVVARLSGRKRNDVYKEMLALRSHDE